MLDQPLDGIRKAQREGYTPAVEMALARYPVTITDVEVGGVACMEVCADGSALTKGTILYLFGGGFMVGSPFEDLPITAALAVKTGARIVAPYYRLAPEHPFPAALDDAFAVAQALSGEGSFCVAGEMRARIFAGPPLARAPARAGGSWLSAALISTTSATARWRP